MFDKLWGSIKNITKETADSINESEKRDISKPKLKKEKLLLKLKKLYRDKSLAVIYKNLEKEKEEFGNELKQSTKTLNNKLSESIMEFNEICKYEGEISTVILIKKEIIENLKWFFINKHERKLREIQKLERCEKYILNKISKALEPLISNFNETKLKTYTKYEIAIETYIKKIVIAKKKNMKSKIEVLSKELVVKKNSLEQLDSLFYNQSQSLLNERNRMEENTISELKSIVPNIKNTSIRMILEKQVKIYFNQGNFLEEEKLMDNIRKEIYKALELILKKNRDLLKENIKSIETKSSKGFIDLNNQIKTIITVSKRITEIYSLKNKMNLELNSEKYTCTRDLGKARRLKEEIMRTHIFANLDMVNKKEIESIDNKLIEKLRKSKEEIENIVNLNLAKCNEFQMIEGVLKDQLSLMRNLSHDAEKMNLISYIRFYKLNKKRIAFVPAKLSKYQDNYLKENLKNYIRTLDLLKEVTDRYTEKFRNLEKYVKETFDKEIEIKNKSISKFSEKFEKKMIVGEKIVELDLELIKEKLNGFKNVYEELLSKNQIRTIFNVEKEIETYQEDRMKLNSYCDFRKDIENLEKEIIEDIKLVEEVNIRNVRKILNLECPLGKTSAVLNNSFIFKFNNFKKTIDLKKSNLEKLIKERNKKIEKVKKKLMNNYLKEIKEIEEIKIFDALDKKSHIDKKYSELSRLNNPTINKSLERIQTFKSNYKNIEREKLDLEKEIENSGVLKKKKNQLKYMMRNKKISRSELCKN